MTPISKCFDEVQANLIKDFDQTVFNQPVDICLSAIPCCAPKATQEKQKTA